MATSASMSSIGVGEASVDDDRDYGRVLRSSSNIAPAGESNEPNDGDSDTLGTSDEDAATPEKRQPSMDDFRLQRLRFSEAKGSPHVASMRSLMEVQRIRSEDDSDPVCTPRADEASSSPLQMRIAVSSMEERAAVWSAFRLQSDVMKRDFHRRGVKLFNGGVAEVIEEDIDAIVCPLTSPFAIVSAAEKWTRRVIEIFGKATLDRLSDMLNRKYYGEAPAGSSLLVPVEGNRVKFVVFVFLCSVEPFQCPPNNTYTAMRGALLAISHHNDDALQHGSTVIRSIALPFFPVLGPVAALPLAHVDVARQMALAFDTTPAYVFWSRTASERREVTALDPKEQHHRMRAQGMRTSEQLARIVTKWLHRALRRGYAGDFALRGFVCASEIDQLAAFAERVPPRSGSKQSQRATEALCSMLRRSAWNVPATSFSRSILVETLRSHVSLYFRITKMPSKNILDEVDISNYEELDRVAVGGTATVYKVRHRRSGAVFALKQFRDDCDVQSFEKEATLAALLESPYIMQTTALGYKVDQRGKKLPFLLTPFFEIGSLYNVLHVSKKRFDRNTSVMMAVRIARAIDYLHDRSLIHRDIKSANVLLNSNFKPFLTDFGTSRTAPSQALMTNMVGTVAWMAPEVVESTEYTQRADVYSFGMILYELFTGEEPFATVHSYHIPIEVLKGVRPFIPKATVPKSIVRLIKSCWQQSAAKRPSIKKVLSILVEVQTSMNPPEMPLDTIVRANQA